MTEQEYWKIIHKGHEDAIQNWWRKFPKAVGCIIMTEEKKPGHVTTKMAPLDNLEDIIYAAKTIMVQPNVLLRTLCFRPWLLEDGWRLTDKQGNKAPLTKDIVTFLEDGEPYITCIFGTIQIDGGELDYSTRTETEPHEDSAVMTLFPKHVLLAYFGKMLGDLAEMNSGKVQILSLEEAIQKFGKEQVEKMIGGKMVEKRKDVKEAAEAPELTILPGIKVEYVPMPKVAEKDRIA